ncbi:MAG: hypothetical protein QOI74_4017 [Micromonosporaceae bacterium]|nr:hypothetical protein [Micromonosporaceae bacterium]
MTIVNPTNVTAGAPGWAAGSSDEGRPGWPSDDAVRLHRTMFGYVSSSAIFSALELGLFDALEEQPGVAEDLGRRLDLPDRSARLILLALLGEGLVERVDDAYRNAPVASRYLVSASPDYVGALAAHQAAHFERFSKLTQALRDNAPVRAPGAGDHPQFGGPERFARITRTAALMMMVDGMVEQTSLAGNRHLVDLGCGSCVYSIALARRNPHLRITAIDRPSVCDLARTSVAEAGLSDRITIRPGDIFEDTVPDADVAMLSNVAEGFDSARAARLVKHVHGWLPAGGELVIHSHMWEHADATPFSYTVGLILAVNNPMGGEPYGEGVTRGWLADAGFGEIKPAVAVSPISAVVRAVK